MSAEERELRTLAAAEVVVDVEVEKP